MKTSIHVRAVLFRAACGLLAAISAPPPGFAIGEVQAAQTGRVSNYEAALAALVRGENQTAVIYLKNELQQNPDNVAARLLLARAYINQGQGQAAERELRTARQRGADPELVLLDLGEAYLIANTPQRVIDEILPGYRNGDAEARIQVLRGRAFVRLDRILNAEEAFTRAADLNPKSVDPYIGLAGIRVDQVKYREALGIIDQAKAINPKSLPMIVMRADILRFMGDMNGALAAYNTAIGLNPKEIGVRLTRAAVLLDLGKFDLASQDINAVLAVSPRNPQAKYLLSGVLAAKGDKQGSEAALADAAATLKSISPESPSIERNILKLAGLVAFERGNIEEANKYISLYVTEAPHDQGGRRLLATIQIRLMNYSEAIDQLKRILASSPNDAAALALQGQASLGLKDFAYAADSYKQAAALKPKDPELHFMLGRVYEAQGNMESALPEYILAAELNPRLKAARIQVVATQIKLGRKQDAAKSAQGLLIDYPGDAECYNLAGVALQGIGRLDLSRKNFVMAIEKNPGFIPAYSNLAEILQQMGDYGLAAKQYQEILKRQPGNQTAFMGLGRLAEGQKNPKAAQGWYERARLAGPQNPAPWMRLINLQAQAKNYPAAIALGQEYINKYPENYDIKKALGIALVKADKLAEAARVYEDVAQIAPDRGQALYELAVVRQMAGNIDGARQALLNAISWNSKYTPAYISLIQIEIKAGNLKNAVNLGKQLRDISPKLADGALGQGYLSTGRYDLAEQSFRAGTARDGNDWGMTLGLYQALLQNGKAAQALDLMEGWKKSHPRDSSAEPMLAAGYLRAGQPAKAIPIFERLAAAYPDNPNILNDLAWAYRLVKDERAQKYAERAFKLMPQKPAIMDTYAWILVQDGQAGRALPLLRQAQARDSQNPAISYHLASALEALGRKEEARVELEKALRPSVHFDEAAQARVMMKRLSGS
jgi:putative PEP-CTERM system TPR-repeat lipoprotein